MTNIPDPRTKSSESPEAIATALASAQRAAHARFFDSSVGQVLPEGSIAERRAAQRSIGDAVKVLATAIELGVPAGRNKSIALTALEDVQMRANRGIFAPDDQK